MAQRWFDTGFNACGFFPHSLSWIWAWSLCIELTSSLLYFNSSYDIRWEILLTNLTSLTFISHPTSTSRGGHFVRRPRSWQKGGILSSFLANATPVFVQRELLRRKRNLSVCERIALFSDALEKSRAFGNRPLILLLLLRREPRPLHRANPQLFAVFRDRILGSYSGGF